MERAALTFRLLTSSKHHLNSGSAYRIDCDSGGSSGCLWSIKRNSCDVRVSFGRLQSGTVLRRGLMQCGWLHSGPQLWLRCVHRQVRVTAGKQELCGWLLTVDPVSHSVALVSFGQDGASVRVVLGHAVEHVEVLQEPDPDTELRLRSLLPPPETGGPVPDDRRRRRSGVRRWLQQNRVPVEEDGNELRVARVLTIRAPYRPDDCSSANQIVLDRVQRLLRVQPDPVLETSPAPETASGPDGPVPPGTRDGL